MVSMMTDEEVLNIYARMVEQYGELLPNPEHQPREFAHYVRLFTYTENANPRADNAPQANS
jgi:hypothetical protein